MKFIDEFRNSDLIRQVVRRIERSAAGNYTFMEVCGGHTTAIRRFGIPSLIPDTIKLVSGPGCPVCVTGTEYIDRLSAYAGMSDVIVVTFGDLLRIPGSGGRTLSDMRTAGGDVRILFSPLDALAVARENRDKRIVFAGIGFETTAPGTAVTLLQAEREKVDNFLVMSAHKLMPPAMEAVIKGGTLLNGFICPGHVAAITGSEAFRFIPQSFGKGCVVSGFEPLDLLLSISMLIDQVNTGKPSVENEYGRVVSPEGNTLALKAMNEVFGCRDAEWRGLGFIPSSGLVPAGKYERFDASLVIPLNITRADEDRNCICGEILRGMKEPSDCRLFASVCTPGNPAGACMVSDEGTCNAWFKYRKSHE